MFTVICFSFLGAPKKIRIEEEDQEYIGKSSENAYECNGYNTLYVEDVFIFDHESSFSYLLCFTSSFS